ncbi:MAG TPA: ferredoxin [Phycisphaerales bacterium]|nr:ferredoxin [Phycisphaerales bacterium]
MAYKITEECTACGSCKDSCPAEAIKEGDPKYQIDADLCIDCGACADTCPVGAIVQG